MRVNGGSYERHPRFFNLDLENNDCSNWFPLIRLMHRKREKGDPMATKDSSAGVNGMIGKMQENFKEAGEQMTERQREVMLKVIENAEENVSAGFDTLRGVIGSENLIDAVKVQQEAVSQAVQRNMEQVREVSEILGGNQEMLNKFSEFMSSMTPGRKG